MPTTIEATTTQERARVSPWPLRAAFLRALHAAAPQLLGSLRELLPNQELWLASFHASRYVRDYADDVEPDDRGRYELARGMWITRLTRWAAPYQLPPWFLECCEETLAVRRAMLRAGLPEPAPASWIPGETSTHHGPVAIPHPELVWLARYQLLQTSIHQLAANVRRDRKTVRLAVQAAAASLGVQLRVPCRGGRGLRAVGDERQLVLRRAAFVVLPVKGSVR
jgi:hypothetical protein